MDPVIRAEGRGQAKLLLFGEHAAVYGHPAVGLSLPESIRARITLGGAQGWRFPRALPADRERLALLLERFRRIIPGLEQAGAGELELVSDIPRGQGFGSSAALCAAAASALCSALGRKDPPSGVWAYAHEAERLFHGTPSGIDTGLALLDGLYLFLPAPPNLPAALRLRGLQLPLVLGAVPRRAETGELIQRLRQSMEAGQGRTALVLGALGTIARSAGQILQGGPVGPGGSPAGERLTLLGELARRAQERLAELELSTPELDALLEQGRRAGALGGKLSGAGGGGAFYLIFSEPQAALSAADLLRTFAKGRMPGAAETIRALVWRSSATQEREA